MPAHPFTSKHVTPSSDFKMESNPDSVLGVQANESFLLRAQRGHVLGDRGETTGFAKYQFQSDIDTVEQLQQDYKAANRLLNATLQDPEVKLYNNLLNEIGVLERNLNQAEQQKTQLASLADTDPQKRAAEQTVTDLKTKLDQKNKTCEAEQKKPKIKSFLEAQAEVKDLYIKSEIPMSIASTTADLFAEPKRMKKDPSLGGDRAMLTRAVASKMVDTIIGTNSITQEKFGKDDQARPIGISIQADGAAITGKFHDKKTFLDVDYSDPRIQRGLSDLEVNDYITGQLDRHSGNIFIDPTTGKVTGIDNDLAFPELDREKVAHSQTAEGKLVPGLPTMIHKESADKIAALNPEELRKQLEKMKVPNGIGRLSDASINGAVDRLQKLQQGIKDGKVQVVDKFDRQTYTAALAKQDQVIQKQLGKSLANCKDDDNQGLLLTPPTSYLGAAEIQRKRQDFAINTDPNAYGLRSPNSVNKATLEPRYEAYLKMNPADQKRFEKTSKEIGDLQDKLSSCQKQLDKLNANPSTLQSIKAAFKGGIDSVKAATLKEESKLIAKLNTKLDHLDQLAGIGTTQSQSQSQKSANLPATQTPSVTTPTPTTVNTTQKTDSQPSVSQDTVTNYNSVVGELAKKKPTLRETHPDLAKSLEKQSGTKLAPKVGVKT